MAKFNKGDLVRCFFDDSGSTDKVGKTGRILEVRENDKYPYKTDFGSWFGDHEIERAVVTHILQYELDRDPIETFCSMQEVEDRIRVLSKRADLKRDSIVVYEVGKTFNVTLQTRIVLNNLLGSKVIFDEKSEDAAPEATVAPTKKRKASTGWRKKVPCRYCHVKFKHNGVRRHEFSCWMNTGE